jgi:hypothetical protein
MIMANKSELRQQQHKQESERNQRTKAKAKTTDKASLNQ